MIKRPIDRGFRPRVLAGIKTCTMRENPWPMNQPIMLYSWEGKPYYSKHDDLAPVIAESATEVSIERTPDQIIYHIPDGLLDRPLWQAEGFDSPEKMDEWFRGIKKKDPILKRYLMIFRLLTEDEIQALKNLNH